MSNQMSMKKSLALSKKMGITFNDLTLGILSKCLKLYFVANDDKSDEITIAIPFTFNTIPKSPSNYSFKN